MNPPSDSQTHKHPVSENGLFWIALILLSMGAITTFYYQDSTALTTISPHIYQYTPASAEASPEKILTLYDADTGKPRTVISLDDAGVE